MTWPLGLSVLLIAYNVVLNRSGVAGTRLYVPVNVGLALLLTAIGLAGSTVEGIGLGGVGRGLTLGSWLAVAGVAVVGAGVFLPGFRPAYHDRRVAGMSGGEVAYGALVRVPLGTALPEELAFRGVLLSAWTGAIGSWPAVIASSAVFGLWHVAPALEALRVNRLVGRDRLVGLTVAVVGSGLVGVGLCGLRLVTGGIWGPFLVHASANSAALVAAHLLQRRGSR